MLKTRIYSAVCLIPLVIAALFTLPKPYFMLITVILFLMMGKEWIVLLDLKKPVEKASYLISLCFCMFMLTNLPPLWIMGTTTLAWVCFVPLILSYRGDSMPKPPWSKQLVVTFMIGYLVLAPSWWALNVIGQLTAGSQLLLLMLLLIWGADMGAYFFGRAFGRRKLAPYVSPGKTIAGLLGAFLVCFLIGLLACWGARTYPQLGLQETFVARPVSWLPTVFLMVCYAVLGDLFQSLYKRIRGIKDTGCLIPGHGGLLDRLDSLTACAPLFAFVCYWDNFGVI